MGVEKGIYTSLTNFSKSTEGLRDNICASLGANFFLIMYDYDADDEKIDPSKVGIFAKDSEYVWTLAHFIQDKDLHVILQGPGGVFDEAILMANALQVGLSGFRTYVPDTCCSALCNIFLKSRKLMVEPKSKITQIDPIFEVEGKYFRAIKHLQSKDQDLREVARNVFHYVRAELKDLLASKPSLFLWKKRDFDEFGHMQELIVRCMKGPTHTKPLKFKDFKEMDLNVHLNDGNELRRATKELIEHCQGYLRQHDRRVMFLTSSKVTVQPEFLQIKSSRSKEIKKGLKEGDYRHLIPDQ